VAVTGSGRIVLGADDGGPHCCLSTYVGRLDADGRLDGSFGTGGWSQKVATGANMEQVMARSDGSVLVELSRIDTGGGTNYVEELDSHGAAVTGFTTNFNADLVELDRAGASLQLGEGGYFDDDIVPLADGSLELVGTGAPNGAGRTPMYLLAWQVAPDGRIDESYGEHGVTRISAVDGGAIVALAMPDGDTVYLDEPWVAPKIPLYGSDGQLRLVYLTRRGTIDAKRPEHGVMLLPASSLLAGKTPAYSDGQTAAAATGDDILVAVSTPGGIDVIGLRG
jgi:hypothetical protein